MSAKDSGHAVCLALAERKAASGVPICAISVLISGGWIWRASNASISSARSKGVSKAFTAADCASLMPRPGFSARIIFLSATATSILGTPKPTSWASALPVEPATDGLAHNECFVGLGDPIDLQHVADALPPGTRHLGDVRAPKQALRAKGII